MMAVLADDFTGAAEIAAIGRRYGLVSEVRTSFRPAGAAKVLATDNVATRTHAAGTDAVSPQHVAADHAAASDHVVAPGHGATPDLVVVDTLTRSCTRGEAGRRVAEEASRLRDGGIEVLHYKKVDSVLRGHVVAELARLVADAGLRRVLLAPANPSFGQEIRGGRYSIDGLPLSETRYAQDPEHPASTSDVLELLGREDGVAISYHEGAHDLPEDGIVITGGAGAADLLALARALDAHTLAAGGAEFFDALLQLQLGKERRAESGRADVAPTRNTLLVVGSGTRPSRMLVERARRAGTPIIGMPRALYEADEDGDGHLAAWAEAALDCLATRGHAIVALDTPAGDVIAPPPRVDLIPARLGDLTAAVARTWRGELNVYVSGGTTASLVVRRLGWTALRVAAEIGDGVATLQPSGVPHRSITVKPGSYPWPDAVVRGLT